ncbi:MAG: hypothetical protein WCC27_13970 [Acidobacteriaceae bacterium]
MSEAEMSGCLTGYYRCPEKYVRLALRERGPTATGYFLFGQDTTCYGNLSGSKPAHAPEEPLHDISGQVETENGTVYLPFDPGEVIANLYREIYVEDWRSGSSSAVAKLYYFLRPVLPVGLRKHLQKFHLRNWDKHPFPRWPVDCSVDNLLEKLLLLSLRESGERRIPFIWFWPEGKSSCALMTHDIETKTGRDFCSTLMDIDESRGIKASMQVIPEERYSVTPEFLQSLRSRGFEIVVHDLNHDGHLYENREQFLDRARKINAYGRQYGSDGFRAAVLYRKQLWYDALKCSFDMSVPNVAHLDPQHGGCCTVMPYFIGDIVELPVTTIQDYTLFHILNDYSIDIWKRQTSIIVAKHGLMSFIIHPDYVLDDRQRAVFEALLDHIAQLRRDHNVWITTPGEVNRWWRQRAQLQLVEKNGAWQMEGPGSDRARLAWASEVDGRLSLSLDPPSVTTSRAPVETQSPKTGMSPSPEAQ